MHQVKNQSIEINSHYSHLGGLNAQILQGSLPLRGGTSHLYVVLGIADLAVQQ